MKMENALISGEPAEKTRSVRVMWFALACLKIPILFLFATMIIDNL